jgi:hypothetical protein
MKKYVLVLVVAIVAIGAALVYQSGSLKTNSGPSTMQTSAPPAPTSNAGGMTTGTVIETMNSGGYTYVHVDTGEERMWAAGPEIVVTTGEVVSFLPGMQMLNFESESLNRTFDEVYFVSEIRTGAEGGDGKDQMPMGHPQVGSGGVDVDNMDFSGIAVPKGGKNIASLYADKGSLAGKTVVVCGKVVKFTPGVMKKNWIHLRDGTGADGTNDLTVTTNAVVNIGDVVVARGVLNVDKDLGFGYKYDIIVEDADVTVE